MLLLILIIIIGIIIFCEYKYRQESYGNCWDMHRLITLPLLIVDAVAILVLLALLIECRVVDGKIELYQNQNKEIEQKIEITVKQYMDFETNTYGELKSDSYINLVSLYPELKADKLVQQQIELYTKNNETITSLKEDKINKTLYKWWIYFGG